MSTERLHDSRNPRLGLSLDLGNIFIVMLDLKRLVFSDDREGLVKCKALLLNLIGSHRNVVRLRCFGVRFFRKLLILTVIAGTLEHIKESIDVFLGRRYFTETDEIVLPRWVELPKQAHLLNQVFPSQLFVNATEDP